MTDSDSAVSNTLEEMSGVELNNKIVALPAFACKKCSNLLSPPIMLVVGVGNVCGSCIELNGSNTTVHNSALELILQNLSIPCRNLAKGCTENVDYFDIPIHEWVCSYRTYQCPLNSECSWKGDSDKLLDHSLEQHPKLTMTNSNDCFKLQIDISTSHDEVKLLYMYNEKFILHIKCNIEGFKLYCIIYYIGNIDKVSDFCYFVEQTGSVNNGNYSLNLGSNNQIYHFSEMSKGFEAKRSLVCDLSLVKQFVHDTVATLLIKIQSKTDSNKYINEQLLNYFECPVCAHFMKPPIHQCLAGHSICISCKSKISQCPTCRGGFANTRNFSLEALGSGMYYPCMYRDQGCKMALRLIDIKKHEYECALQIYACPFYEVDTCDWKGVHSTIVDHLKHYHSEDTKFSNYNKKSVDVYDIGLFCLITLGQIFRVCFKRTEDDFIICFSVQLVGPKSECKKYKYEVGLISIENETRRLIRIDECLSTEKDNMFKHSMMISDSVTSWYPLDGEITYYCKVSKMSKVVA